MDQEWLKARSLCMIEEKERRRTELVGEHAIPGFAMDKLPVSKSSGDADAALVQIRCGTIKVCD